MVPRAKFLVGDGACMCLWGASNSIRVVRRNWVAVLGGVQELLQANPEALAAARSEFFDLPVVVNQDSRGHEEEDDEHGGDNQGDHRQHHHA